MESKQLGSIAQIGFILVAAAAVFGFVRSAQSDERRGSCTALCSLGPAYAGRNRIAPDFELPDMDGKMVRLSSFRGKTVFLNFWTQTCDPCKKEMPSVAELAKVAKTRDDMVVITVSTDEGPSAVKDTLTVLLNEPPPFPVLFDPDANIVRDRYGTRLYPETWIIDPKGIIRARFDGARDWSSAMAIEIGEMVKKPAGCPIDFFKGMPRGDFAGLCGDDS
ncbi:MAG: TlpA disulfide reductase family protein [Byssovorax sp.]